MTNNGSLARKTLVGAGWLVLWRVLTRLLGFASTLILARLLVPADFGLVAMASTFAYLVEAMSEVGIQDGLVRHPSHDRALLDTGFSLQVARAVVTSGAVALAAPLAAWWFSEPRLEALLYVLAAANLLAGFENVGIVEYQRALRFDVQFRLLIIPRLLQLATTIPLAIMTESYWSLILGTVVGRVSRTILTYAFHPYRPRFAISRWRDLASFSLWTWASSLTNVLWDRLDAFVLGPSLGSSRLGTYLLAQEVAVLPVSELVAPTADALFAGFVSAQRQGGGAADVALRVSGALVLLVLPAVVGISCAAGHVVAALLGPRWAEAAPVIAILAWLCVLSPFSYVCGTALIAHGLVRLTFHANLVKLLVKLALLVGVVAVTDRLEAVAAAVVFCVALEALILAVLLHRTSPAPLRPLLGSMARGALAAGAAAGALAAAGLVAGAVETSSAAAVLRCLLTGVVSLATYGTVLMLLWLLFRRPEGSESLLLGLVRRDVLPLVVARLRPRPAG